jgi:hypothetical protein
LTEKEVLKSLQKCELSPMGIDNVMTQLIKDGLVDHCGSCKYDDYESPCYDCDDKYSRWEAKDD